MINIIPEPGSCLYLKEGYRVFYLTNFGSFVKKLKTLA